MLRKKVNTSRKKSNVQPNGKKPPVNLSGKKPNENLSGKKPEENTPSFEDRKEKLISDLDKLSGLLSKMMTWSEQFELCQMQGDGLAKLQSTFDLKYTPIKNLFIEINSLFDPGIVWDREISSLEGKIKIHEVKIGADKIDLKSLSSSMDETHKQIEINQTCVNSLQNILECLANQNSGVSSLNETQLMNLTQIMEWSEETITQWRLLENPKQDNKTSSLFGSLMEGLGIYQDTTISGTTIPECNHVELIKSKQAALLSCIDLDKIVLSDHLKMHENKTSELEKNEETLKQLEKSLKSFREQKEYVNQLGGLQEKISKLESLRTLAKEQIASLKDCEASLDRLEDKLEILKKQQGGLLNKVALQIHYDEKITLEDNNQAINDAKLKRNDCLKWQAELVAEVNSIKNDLKKISDATIPYPGIQKDLVSRITTAQTYLGNIQNKWENFEKKHALLNSSITLCENKIKEEQALIEQRNAEERARAAKEKEERLVNSAYNKMKREYRVSLVDAKVTQIIENYEKIVSQLRPEDESLKIFIATFNSISSCVTEASSGLDVSQKMILQNSFESFLFELNDETIKSCQVDIIWILSELTKYEIKLSPKVLTKLGNVFEFSRHLSTDAFIENMQICCDANIHISQFLSKLSARKWSSSQALKLKEICDTQKNSMKFVNNYEDLLGIINQCHMDEYLRKMSSHEEMSEVILEFNNLLDNLLLPVNCSFLFLRVFESTFKKISDLYILDSSKHCDLSHLFDKFASFLSQYNPASNASQQHEMLVSILRSIHKLNMLLPANIANQMQPLFHYVHRASNKDSCTNILLSARVGLNIKDIIRDISKVYDCNKEQLATLLYACVLHDANSKPKDHVDKEIITAFLKKASGLFLQQAGTLDEMYAGMFHKAKYENDAAVDVMYYRFLFQAACFYGHPLGDRLTNILTKYISINDVNTVSDEQKYLHAFLEAKFNENANIEVLLERTTIAGISSDIVILNLATGEKYIVEYDGPSHVYNAKNFALTDTKIREDIARDKITYKHGYTTYRFNRTHFGLKKQRKIDPEVEQMNLNFFSTNFYINRPVINFVSTVQGQKKKSFNNERESSNQPKHEPVRIMYRNPEAQPPVVPVQRIVPNDDRPVFLNPHSTVWVPPPAPVYQPLNFSQNPNSSYMPGCTYYEQTTIITRSLTVQNNPTPLAPNGQNNQMRVNQSGLCTFSPPFQPQQGYTPSPGPYGQNQSGLGAFNQSRLQTDGRPLQPQQGYTPFPASHGQNQSGLGPFNQPVSYTNGRPSQPQQGYTPFPSPHGQNLSGLGPFNQPVSHTNGRPSQPQQGHTPSPGPQGQNGQMSVNQSGMGVFHHPKPKPHTNGQSSPSPHNSTPPGGRGRGRGRG